MYGQEQGNACLAQQMYHEPFLRRCSPRSTIFTGIHRRSLETGSFPTSRFDVVRSRNIRTPTMGEDVVQRFKNNSSTSTKAVASQIGISYKNV